MSPAAVHAIVTGVAAGDAIHRKLVDVLVGRKCPDDVRDTVTKEYLSIADDAGLYPVTVLKQLVGAARFHVKRRLKSLRVPTMVVYGTDDLFVPNINSRKLVQYIPNARLVPIEDGGHELTLDKGDELAAVVRDWTRSQARPTANSAG
jgi:pimeloyl-ACP methyl ester carboxylesterase